MQGKWAPQRCSALVTVDATPVQPAWPQWWAARGSLPVKAVPRAASSPEGSPRLSEGYGSRHPICNLYWQIKSPEARNAVLLLDEHKIRGDRVGSPLPAPPPDRGSPSPGPKAQGSPSGQAGTLQGLARTGRSCIAGSRRVCASGRGAALAGRWWCAECSQADLRLAKGPRRIRRVGRAWLIAVPLTQPLSSSRTSLLGVGALSALSALSALVRAAPAQQFSSSSDGAFCSRRRRYELPSSMNQRGASAPGKFDQVR
ncbi:hypothetical protein GGI43DRAFT_217434 [Trichoderma evansii]